MDIRYMHEVVYMNMQDSVGQKSREIKLNPREMIVYLTDKHW
jgi:hypothetical protein